MASGRFYAFVAPCSDRLMKENPDVCRDRLGFDRVEFHARLNEQIFEYFGRTLDSGDTQSPYGLSHGAPSPVDSGLPSTTEREPK